MLWRIRSALKTSLLSVAWCFDKLAPWPAEHHVAVLNYHDIDDRVRSPYTVTPRNFASQIRSIHRAGFTFLDASQFQRLMAGQVPAHGAKWVLVTFDDGYESFETHAKPILREYGASAILFIHTDRGSSQIGDVGPLLDWEAIDRLRTEGFEIGNHGHSHRSFCTISNDAIDEELDRSEAIFRKETRLSPRFFAYPGGGFDERMDAKVAQHGYSLAFGSRQRRAAPSSNPMNLERICVRSETSPRQLFFALSGALDRYEALRHGPKAERRMRMASQVSWRWRLAGWLRTLPEFRGRDRLGAMILRGVPPPAGVVRCVIGPGLVFDARMRDDGSWVDIFFLQYESPSLAPVLDAFLESGSTFVDIGANIGVYTAWASRRVRSSGRVIAFEPLPTTCEQLERVVALNSLGNVRVVPKALGAGPGTVNLWVVPHASGLTSAIAPAEQSSARRVEVPMITLDDELSKADGASPALVKIDVEGYEMAVLQGAVRTLAASDGPAILFETQSDQLARAGVRFADIPGWFEDRFGYRLFALLPAGLQPIAPGETTPPATNTLALHPDRHRLQFDRLQRVRFRRNQTC